MFRVIIVDDEPKVRRGLSKLIPELDCDWEIAGEARNGAEAIEIVKQTLPDLVITDIRMPQMNGLDLLSALKEYPVHVVILSGYGFFEYAQTAVKFGAFDYLLKPVKPQEIKSMLHRVKERKRTRDLPETNVSNPLYYSKLWKDWLLQQDEARQYEGKLRELLPGDACTYQIMAVEIDRFDELIMEDQWGDRQLVSFAVRNVIQEIIAEGQNSAGMLLFSSGPQLYYLLTSGILEREAAARLIEEIKKWVKLSISVGLSGLTQDFGDLPSLYRHAGEALQNKLIHGDGIVGRYEDLAMNVSGYPSGTDESIVRAIRGGHQEKALEGLASFMRTVKEANVSFRLFNLYGLQLLSSVYRVVYENKILDLVTRKAEQSREMFRRDFTPEEYLRFMAELIRHTVESMEWNRQQKHNRTIDKAIDFIRKNHAIDISLEDVALQAGMSVNYFSSFFKQETGDNFVEYLMRFRIDKAKTLMMNSELRLYEISRLVGYQDVKYFSRLFKRHVGVTPAEYRQFFYRKED